MEEGPAPLGSQAGGSEPPAAYRSVKRACRPVASRAGRPVASDYRSPRNRASRGVCSRFIPVRLQKLPAVFPLFGPHSSPVLATSRWVQIAVNPLVPRLFGPPFTKAWVARTAFRIQS